MTAKPYIILYHIVWVSIDIKSLHHYWCNAGLEWPIRQNEGEGNTFSTTETWSTKQTRTQWIIFFEFLRLPLLQWSLKKKKKGYLWITHIWNYTLLLDLMTKLYNADITCLKCGNKIWQHFGFFNMFCGSDKKTRE